MRKLSSCSVALLLLTACNDGGSVVADVYASAETKTAYAKPIHEMTDAERLDALADHSISGQLSYQIDPVGKPISIDERREMLRREMAAGY